MKAKQIFLMVLSVLILFDKAQAQAWSDQEHAIALAKMEFKAKRVIPGSPEAASLGQYGNTPMNLFTGSANISIPLLEVKGNSLKLPISMSYNSTGFKPDEVAGWVGLNWNLIAGGVITRSAMGNPDVAANYFSSAYNYLNYPSSSQPFAFYDYAENMQKGIMETQPDVYYYNFNGHSGKFYIAPNQVIYKKDVNELKINHCITCTASSDDENNQNYFTIIDENGITYEFKSVEISTLTLDDAYGDVPSLITNYNYPSSWYLTKIISPDGNEEIELSYHNVLGEHYLNKGNLSSKSVTYTYVVPTQMFWMWSNATTSTPPINAIKRKYLKKITLKRNGTIVNYVDLISDADQRLDLDNNDFPGERLLKSVRYYAKSTTENFPLNKDFTFSYSYFSTLGNNKRLRLDSITEKPVNLFTKSKPPYIFEYDTMSVLPSRTSASIDHWGYYNGEENVETLVPQIVFEGMNFGDGANREPDLFSTQLTAMKKIVYPTGGYSTFEYELNKAKEILGGTIERNIGGLRIKKIVDYDATNHIALEKQYTYIQNDGSTSGTAYFPVYHKVTSHHDYNPPVVLGPIRSYEPHTTYVTVTANSQFSLGTFQGSHIGYSRVTEKTMNGSNYTDFGKTEYYYNTFMNDVKNDDISNGDLIKKIVYDYSGKILQKDSSSYRYYSYGGLPNYTLEALPNQDNKTVLCKHMNGNEIEYIWRIEEDNVASCILEKNVRRKSIITGFTTNKQMKHLKESFSEIYDQTSNEYIKHRKEYFYESALLTTPTKIYDFDSKDKVLVTHKRYAKDFNIPVQATLDSITLGIQNLQQKNLGAFEIEAIQFRQNFDSTDKKYLNGQLTIYDPVLPYPVRMLRQESTSPLTSFTYSSTNGIFSKDSHYKDLAFFNYDQIGNLIQQQKVADIPTSYLWDYAGMLPIAEISNSDNNSFAYAGFETSNLGGWNSNVDISNLRRKGFIGNFSMSYPNTLQFSKANLIPTRSYKITYWSKNGALNISNNLNATGTLIVGSTALGWTFYEHSFIAGITSFTIASSSNNENIIDELKLFPTDARLTTVTYNSLDGNINAQVSPNNSINKYEYDGYERLKVLRDENNNILKTYNYGFGSNGQIQYVAQEQYFNVEFTQKYLKSSSTCSVGSTPDSVTYTVEAGKYMSTISQEDANAQAISDLNANGQTYADSYGSCTSSMIDILCSNTSSGNPIYILFTNTSTNEQSFFSTYMGDYLSTVGSVEPGIYNIDIYNYDGGLWSYDVGCGHFAYGYGSFGFYNVQINANCNTITIY